MWTPLIDSRALAKKYGIGKVTLKLENCQMTGSFKDRAMLGLLTYLKKEGKKGVICSSGGNAGVACAYNAYKLGLKAKVFVPVTTRSLMIDRLKIYDAEVFLVGNNWQEADNAARAYLNDPITGQDMGYASPFNHPEIWKGNAKLMEELKTQWDAPPDVIICSVGGGGLMGGILSGLKDMGNTTTTVLGVETDVTNCFSEALKERKVVTVKTNSLITNTLSISAMAEGVLTLALERGDKVKSLVLTDRDAVEGVEMFMEEHRMFVEASCGVSVAALQHVARVMGKDAKDLSVIVIICGGSAMNSSILAAQKEMVGLVPKPVTSPLYVAPQIPAMSYGFIPSAL